MTSVMFIGLFGLTKLKFNQKKESLPEKNDVYCCLFFAYLLYTAKSTFNVKNYPYHFASAYIHSIKDFSVSTILSVP